MKLEQESWFNKSNRNTRGYSQIEERLYFLHNSELTKDQRTYELSVVEKLVSMIPVTSLKLTYSHKLRLVDK